MSKEAIKESIRYRTLFPYKPKAYFFKASSKVNNPKVGSFLRAPEDFEGLGSQKNLIFQNAQMKV